MSFISYTHATSNPARRSAVKQETENIHAYLNQATSGSWLKYDFGSCGLNEAGYGDDGERDFIRDVLDKLDSDVGLITDENVMIAHDVWEWGYGASLAHATSGGTSCYGAAVYAGAFANSWETRAFTWHECAHAYVAGSEAEDHEKGTYNLSNGYISEITPLCTGYLYDANGQTDTRFAGSAPKPDSFCNGESNDQYLFDDPYDREANHDYSKYSSCTLNGIENWL